jgi:general secretion pathway protein H
MVGSRPRSESGFTLIEVIIVLAVIGLVFWAGLSGLRKVTKTSLREDGMELAATLRTAYNLATETGRHHRVVFDLNEQIYRIETCEGKLLLRKTDEEEVPDEKQLKEIEDRLERAKQQMQNNQQPVTMGANTSDMVPEIIGADSPERAMEAAAALAGVRLGSSRCHPPTRPDGKPDARGKVHAIRKDRGLSVRQVYVSHLQEPAKEGTVAINFFPLGYAEKAVVELVDKDNEQYTLLVHRMTGRVEFRSDEVDIDEFLNRNAAGDDDEEQAR